MNTIQEQWEQFEALVINKNAPDIQRTEMKRAFYGGVQAMINVQWELSDKSVSEEAAVHMLEGLHQECQMFAKQVIEGKA